MLDVSPDILADIQDQARPANRDGIIPTALARQGSLKFTRTSQDDARDGTRVVTLSGNDEDDVDDTQAPGWILKAILKYVTGLDPLSDAYDPDATVQAQQQEVRIPAAHGPGRTVQIFRDQDGNPVPRPEVVNRADRNWRGVSRVRDSFRADRPDERWTPADYKKCATFLKRARKEGFQTIEELARSPRLFWSSEFDAEVTWFATLKPPWNDMAKMPFADYIATHPTEYTMPIAQRRARQPQYAARVTYGPSAPLEEWDVVVTPIAQRPATVIAQQAIDAAAREDQTQQAEVRQATRQSPRQKRVGRRAAPRDRTPPADPQPAMEWQPRNTAPRDRRPPRGSASQEVACGSNWQPQTWDGSTGGSSCERTFLGFRW